MSGTLLRGVFRRDRGVTLAGLALLCVLAWAYLLGGAGTGMRPVVDGSPFPHLAGQAMAAMPMPAEPAWDLRAWAVGVAMWWVMMVAMMAPSAAPAILLYERVRERASVTDGAPGLASVWTFAAAYFLVWLGFSALAATLQRALLALGAIAPMSWSSASKPFSVGLLAVAGLYQLTPLQGRCLSRCRSPASFLVRHWRPGPGAALRLGALHGAYCVGCCWGLMALLFVGGVMNLAWIAGLTVVVAAEKLAPGGRAIRLATAAVLLAWALGTALR